MGKILWLMLGCGAITGTAVSSASSSAICGASVACACPAPFKVLNQGPESRTLMARIVNY